MFNLNNEQQKAVDGLIEFQRSPSSFYIISGAAGTGKSYTITQWLKIKPKNLKVCFTAPTNKATRVLKKFATRNNLSADCVTIHSLLGMRIEYKEDKQILVRGYGKSRVHEYDVIVVDEASMVTLQLFKIISEICKQTRIKFIFLGDNCQIKGVGELSSIVFSLPKDAELTKVERQSDNPVLALCVQVRNSILTNGDIGKISTNVNNDKSMGVYSRPGSQFGDWINSLFTSANFNNNQDYCRVIAYRNATVDDYNNYIQKIRYPGLIMPFAAGEPIVFSSPLLVVSSNHGLSIDDFATEGWNSIVASTESEAKVIEVTEVTPMLIEANGFKNSLRRFAVKCELMDVESGNQNITSFTVTNNQNKLNMVMSSLANEAKKNREWFKFHYLKSYFASARPAYCMTCDKAQGSTFMNGFVVATDILKNDYSQEDAKHRLYTAVSRFSHNVVIDI